MVQERIQVLKMSLVDRPVKIARDLIDPEGVRELAESIRENGLIEPIIVRPSNGRFEVVAGDRRYLAHKLLDLKEIKAIVKELDDRETIVIRGIENLQRENLTPSEEAKLYTLLKVEGGLSVKAICRKMGKTEKTVSRYIWFGGFPEDVRRAVDEKRVSLEVLEVLGGIDDADMFKYFFEMAASNGVSAATARLWVDDYHKTQMNTFYDGDGGSPGGSFPAESKPSFITCDVCHGAVEIKVVRSLMVCPECRKKVSHS